MKNTKPTFTIFAGINGAGKTTLFEYLNSIGGFSLGKYVCPDFILKEKNGNWENPADKISSGRDALSQISQNIKNKETFCWETTIFSNLALKTITAAKDAGFNVSLHYIFVSSLQTSLERIEKRVSLGGHGVDEIIVKSRYNFQTKNLAEVLDMVDTAYLYENQDMFRIKVIKNNNDLIQIDSHNIPNSIFTEYKNLIENKKENAN